MAKGYVYVLSNSAMPGLLKIGRTINSPEDRARQLDQTGVPMPFVVECAYLSPDCEQLESRVHEALRGVRAREEREFFKIELDDAKSCIELNLIGQIADIVAIHLPDYTLILNEEHDKYWEIISQSDGDIDG